MDDFKRKKVEAAIKDLQRALARGDAQTLEVSAEVYVKTAIRRLQEAVETPMMDGEEI